MRQKGLYLDSSSDTDEYSTVVSGIKDTQSVPNGVVTYIVDTEEMKTLILFTALACPMNSLYDWTSCK